MAGMPPIKRMRTWAEQVNRSLTAAQPAFRRLKRHVRKVVRELARAALGRKE